MLHLAAQSSWVVTAAAWVPWPGAGGPAGGAGSAGAGAGAPPAAPAAPPPFAPLRAKEGALGAWLACEAVATLTFDPAGGAPSFALDMPDGRPLVRAPLRREALRFALLPGAPNGAAPALLLTPAPGCVLAVRFSSERAAVECAAALAAVKRGAVARAPEAGAGADAGGASPAAALLAGLVARGEAESAGAAWYGDDFLREVERLEAAMAAQSGA
jgi:hypothetical protein